MPEQHPHKLPHYWPNWDMEINGQACYEEIAHRMLSHLGTPLNFQAMERLSSKEMRRRFEVSLAFASTLCC